MPQRRGIENVIEDIVRRGRLRWYGHIQRKEGEDWIKKIIQHEVPGWRSAGRPRKVNWHEDAMMPQPQPNYQPPKMEAGHKRGNVHPRIIWKTDYKPIMMMPLVFTFCFSVTSQ